MADKILILALNSLETSKSKLVSRKISRKISKSKLARNSIEIGLKLVDNWLEISSKFASNWLRKFRDFHENFKNQRICNFENINLPYGTQLMTGL